MDGNAKNPSKPLQQVHGLVGDQDCSQSLGKKPEGIFTITQLQQSSYHNHTAPTKFIQQRAQLVVRKNKPTRTLPVEFEDIGLWRESLPLC